jgi:hypothetical protein
MNACRGHRAIPLVLICLLSALGLSAPLAPAEPPAGVRDLVAELVVRVRTTDRAADQEIDSGCGLIIGFDAETLTILTARHVVEASMRGDTPARVAVLFQGTGTWRECVVGPPLGDANTTDAAFVRVKRKDAPFDRDPLCKDLVLSRPPAAGTVAHAYGFDTSKDHLAWRAAIFGAPSTAGGPVSFEGEGVAGGFSGGPLLSDVGVVAMTIQAGPNGKEHRALEVAPLLALVRSKGGSVQIRENPAVAALDLAFAEKLVVAADVWDLARGKGGDSFWVALSPKSRNGDAYVFDAMSAKSRFEITVRPEGDGVAIDIPSDLRGKPQSTAMLATGKYALRVDPSVVIPGLLVLKAESADRKAVLYLALPLELTELLAARAMVDAAIASGPPVLTKETIEALDFDKPPHCSGAPMPFSVVVGSAAALSFHPPLALHRNKEISVRGALRVPDAFELQKDPKRAAASIDVWNNLRFLATDRLGEKELASDRMAWEGKDIRLSLPPSSELVRAGCSQPTPEQKRKLTAKSFLLMHGLRLEYQRP